MSFDIGISDPIYLLRTSQCLDRGTSHQHVLLKWDTTAMSFQMILQAQAEPEVWAQWPIEHGFDAPRLGGEWVKRSAFAVSLPLAVLAKILKSCALGGTLYLHCRPRLASAAPSKEEAGEMELSMHQLVTLTLVGERENVAGKKMKMTQSVPALLYSEEQLNQVEEPMIPHPQLHVQLSSPHLFILRGLVDKLKPRHVHLSIRGWSERERGSLELSAQDASTITILLSSLVIPPLTIQHSPSPSPSPSPGTAHPSVTVAAKDLHQCLQCHSLSPVSIILGLLHDSALVLYVHWPPAILTFFLPAKRLGGSL